MDDSCAVCADTLEWVAYGACGHRDVCSTCVARLRFICEDRRCCICKTECSAVFVTKALGDYTRMINDFSVLPSEPREGRVGSYWYHEDTQAFFDDVDHYRMIKAMCRLSCSVCDKEEEQQPSDGPRPRRQRFRNIEQLKGHLNHRHRLSMCLLCLEGRKVFICEQKLYTKAQLKQHINTGDSEVDGTESERGGFMGHPMCEFCRVPFYGDNELYTHMSREHFTCHICQRQLPGQYEYYRNYEDLEIHFRREHFLCEDEACLLKKFIVFQSEAELKRHNTLEHGGRMSRSKRNAALQIPTSFRYRRSYEHDNRRRAHTFHRDESDNQLSQAIQASLETGDPGGTSCDVPSSSTTQVRADADDADPLVQPFEVLTTTDSELSSRYLQALGQNSSRNTPLGESSFPPLPGAPQSSKQETKQESKVLPNKTMAAHLQRQMNGNAAVFSSAQSWQGGPSSSTAFRPPLSNPPSMSRSPASGPAVPANGNSTQAQPLARPSTQAQPLARPTGHGYLLAVSPGNSGNISRITHSVSAPNLSGEELLKPSVSDFPPVSASQVRKVPTGSQVHLNLEDVKVANRSLVEKMRAALGHDEDIFSSFKEISADFREGRIDTREYLGYVQQYGLSHLVLDLARLCPDPQKQKELVDVYNAGLKSSGPQENVMSHGSIHLKSSNGSKKGKGIDTANSSSKDGLADSILSTVRTLQSYQRPLEEEVEVLSKDGYRSAKGKTVALVDERQLEVRGQNGPESAGDSSNQNNKGGAGSNKPKKKTSKFQRVRLGDGSMESLVDFKNSDNDPDPDPLDDKNPTGGLPVRGVWRKGGGQKLFS